MEKSVIFLGISLFCFLFFIVTGIVALAQPHDFGKIVIFWTIFSERYKYFNTNIPVVINHVVLYILFVIPLCLASVAGAFLIIYRNDGGVNSGMFGTFSQFHFIPLICASALFIIGESFSDDNLYKDGPYICSFIFSIIGVGSLIFIYLKTDIPSPLKVKLVIKKGLYPSLMALFIYNFCFTFGLYGCIKKLYNLEIDTLLDWVKGCSIAFSIIIGLVILGIAFFFKDACLVAMNFLIYLGLVIYFFNIDKDDRSKLNGAAEGVIEIIIIVLSLATISFMIYKYKNEILN